MKTRNSKSELMLRMSLGSVAIWQKALAIQPNRLVKANWKS
jgi:hypothetical protein